MGSPQNIVQLVFPTTTPSFREGMDATWFSRSIPRDRLQGRRSIVPSVDPALREKKSPPRITDVKRQGRIFLCHHCHQYRLLHEEVLPPRRFFSPRERRPGILR